MHETSSANRCDPSDRRTWSISARNLSRFVHFVRQAGVPNGASRLLHQELKRSEVYPATNLEGLCKPIPPDVFVTYHSALPFAELEELVWKTCHFAAQQVSGAYDDLHVEEVMEHGIRFWIDFLFIDQNSRDIIAELDILPALLETADVHIVLGSDALTRVWCCHEIALFNRHCATDGSATSRVRSFIAPTTRPYMGWDHIEATNADDKRAIGEQISNDFPSGMDGFRRVMDEASASAVLSHTERNPSYPPAALEAIKGAAERWFLRDVRDFM